MTNLVRSFFIALFLTINAWLFIRFEYPATAVGLFLSTALLIAVRQLGPKRTTTFVPDPYEVPASLFPYGLSLPLVAGLGAMVYRKISQGDAYFFSPFLDNWTMGETLLLLLLSSALVAAALVIAISAAFAGDAPGFRKFFGYDTLPRGELVRTSVTARVFRAHRSELWRFLVYFYAILFFWALALVVLYGVNDSWAFPKLLMICARTSLCLGIAIVGVLFGMPFIVFFLIGAGVYAWALSNSLGAAQTAVFIGIMIGCPAVFLFILGRWHAGRDPGYSVKT